DVNSLYPYVMATNPYPCKYQEKLQGIDGKTLQRALISQSATAKVLIDTDEPAYAVRRSRTIFPIGRFWVTLTTPELLYALEHNHIVKIDSVVFYEQADLFSGYVNRFYKMRQEFKSAGVKSYDTFCKYMLNSLYGKFGQKADIWTKIGDCPDEPDRIEILFTVGEKGVKQLRYLLGEIFISDGYEESYNSFPAIAAHVAAYGRMHLYNLMQITGMGNYYYCDTDSLIVNEVGLCNLQNQIDENKLGSLKIDESGQSLTVRGLKDYTTEA
ncbi:unnamed protein product, partial [marine sediment metagenome]